MAGGSVGHQDASHLIVKRDDMEWHFWKTDDRQFPENTSCAILGGQVAALHEAYWARGLSRQSPFRVRPWNLKDFCIHALPGNLPKVGCRDG